MGRGFVRGSYDIAPDGRILRITVATRGENQRCYLEFATDRVDLVTNFFQVLREKVPTADKTLP
jgi:hypothetical protein